MTQKPSIGRIVHYVLEAGDGVKDTAVGEHRPGIVVRVPQGNDNECPDGINLQVFVDGSNDDATTEDPVALWVTSVPYSAEPKPGTWHWPEVYPG